MYFNGLKFLSNSVIMTFFKLSPSIELAFIIFIFSFISSLIQIPFSVMTAKYLLSVAKSFLYQGKYVLIVQKNYKKILLKINLQKMKLKQSS